MKYLKKLLVVVLTLALILPIFSTVKVKADSSFSLEDLSADEIVDLIFDSCSGIYPKEGQTTEEWATFLNKKIPFLDSKRVDNFKTRRWNYSQYVDFVNYTYSSSSISNIFTSCEIWFGRYAEAMDGSFHLADNDNDAKYIKLTFNLSDNYKKASNLYDKLVKKLSKYYNTGKDSKNTESNYWSYTINGMYDSNAELTTYIGSGDFEYPRVLSLSKTNDGYTFSILFIHPNYLKNPTEFAKSMLKSSGSTSDEDEFVFDEAIELEDPSIKSLTNKKGKKLVIKFAGDSSFDNETFKIQVSTSKKFKSLKEFETKKSSATISNLKKGKTYYVRVMYTVTEDGETVSSNWSKTKSITIKK